MTTTTLERPRQARANTTTVTANTKTNANTAPTPMENKALGWQSYMWGYALVDMYIQKEKRTSGPGSNGSNAPINNFGYAETLNDDSWQTGLYPNCDLLYTMAQLDLTAEPVVLAVPAVDDERYFSVPLYDAYNHVCASFGTLQGDKFAAGDYLIKGPDSPEVEGEESFAGVVVAPSNYVWIAARTMVFLDENAQPHADYPAARAFADQYKATELSEFLRLGGDHKEAAPFGPEDIFNDPGMPTEEAFFLKLRDILENHEPNWPERERFFAKQFMDLNLEDPEVMSSLLAAEADCKQFFTSRSPGVLRTNWNYLYALGAYEKTPHRAQIAFIGGAAANEAHEAFYPLGLHASDKENFHGDNDYSMVFEGWANNQIPFADPRGYWSLTIYDQNLNPVTGLDFWSVGSRNLPENPADAVDPLTGHLTLHSTLR